MFPVQRGMAKKDEMSSDSQASAVNMLVWPATFLRLREELTGRTKLVFLGFHSVSTLSPGHVSRISYPATHLAQ
jgi:hypothetical protein